MANTLKPVVEAVSLPSVVTINQKFTISVTVTDAEMVVTFYLDELFSGEV